VWELDQALEDDSRAADLFAWLATAGVATWLASFVLADSLLPITSIDHRKPVAWLTLTAFLATAEFRTAIIADKIAAAGEQEVLDRRKITSIKGGVIFHGARHLQCPDPHGLSYSDRPIVTT